MTELEIKEISGADEHEEKLNTAAADTSVSESEPAKAPVDEMGLSVDDKKGLPVDDEIGLSVDDEEEEETFQGVEFNEEEAKAILEAASSISKRRQQRRKRNINDNAQWKYVVADLLEFVEAKRMIVLPIVVGMLLVLVSAIAISANQRKKTHDDEKVQAEAAVEQTEEGIAVPDVDLELNAYPAVNELLMTYYKAVANGDMETVKRVMRPVSETYEIRLGEFSKFIDSYTAVNAYTKPGPVENSFVAYAYTEVMMTGFEGATVPGLSAFYVCNDGENYYINMSDDLSEDETNYIKAIDLTDDVIDLNNKVTVEFNDLLAENSDFQSYYTDFDEQLTAAVGAVLEEKKAAEEAAQTTENNDNSEAVAAVNKIVKATDVVNMRSSDSEKADKVGKAQIGYTFNVLEEKANGWTKVLADGKEVYIKSQYLETVSETPVEASANGAAAEEQNTAPAVNASLGSNGYVTATTTVNVRKSANENGEKLGKVYQGEKLELIMNQADGWCKVKYKGKTAYVKAEFME